MIPLLTEQDRHEQQRRLDELEELGIGRRACAHVTTELPSGESRRAGITYRPGHTPEAPDWDPSNRECGGGLHGCPRPVYARRYNETATRYVAVKVPLADIAVFVGDGIADKVRFPRCTVVGEVDIDGEAVPA